MDSIVIVDYSCENKNIDIFDSTFPSLCTQSLCKDDAKEESKQNIPNEHQQTEQSNHEKFDYLVHVSRTTRECLEEYEAPQRTKKWFLARKYCLTASNFGAAAGNNKFCSPEECAIEKVRNKFVGNEATAYGTFHESDARDSLLAQLNTTLQEFLKQTYFDATGGIFESFDLQECGLMKHSQQPWMAVSPDGILKLVGSKMPIFILVEYKCPFSKKDSTKNPYHYYKDSIPPYYYDQIQGIMGYLKKYPESSQYRNIFMCLFVVWQPHQMFIKKFTYNHSYYQVLEEKLKHWYFQIYLPLLK